MLLAIGGALWWGNSPRLPDRSHWVQLTKFPDSVTQPTFRRMAAWLHSSGQWIVAWAPIGGNGPPSTQVFPLNGGAPVQIGNFNPVSWSSDGRSVLIGAYLIPLKPGEVLPQIPAGGFQSDDEIAHMLGARLIGDGVVFGPSAGVYAFSKTTVQRNLYRIPIS